MAFRRWIRLEISESRFGNLFKIANKVIHRVASFCNPARVLRLFDVEYRIVYPKDHRRQRP